MPQVSDSGELTRYSRLSHPAAGGIAFPCTLLGRHSREVISELTTAPVRSPANPAESGTTPSLVVDA